MRRRHPFLGTAFVVAACAAQEPIGSTQNIDPGGVEPDGAGSSESSIVVDSALVDAASCQSDSDCGAGRQCGYPIADGCQATGTCFCKSGGDCHPQPPAPPCALILPGCACDGTVISVVCDDLPSGYLAKPLLHEGLCEKDATPE